MFDKIDIEATVPDYIQSTMFTLRGSKDIQFGDIILVPVKCPSTRLLKEYRAQIDNLLITYKHTTSTIRVSNSIQKFHKGNNHSDMYFSEMSSVLNKIEEMTGIKMEQWIIKKVEIGFNIEVKKAGTEYLRLFSTFKNKTPDKMRKDALWYGIKWFFTEYELKIYDKTEETKRHNRISLDTNLLRFEIAIKRVRKIPVIQFMSDLRNKNKLKEVFNYFISEISKIETIECMDFSRVGKERDIEMFFAGQNELYWQTQKEINPKGVKEKRKRYLRILNEISTKNIMVDFLEKLQDKFHQFIST